MADEKTGILKEFQAFILRGNVVDLAVGVVIGAAFGSVITSLVENVLTPLTGIFRVPDFRELRIDVGPSAVNYGLFLNSVIAFLLVAATIFFFVVKPLNRLMAHRKTEPDVVSTTRDCPECLSAIPKAASRCAFCTAEVPAEA
ncbi:MAG TPA: large conductance mechanosensitive channel protein MscL [Actinomycetota bacterium]|nr:large conductance mechanosensitive channel protein MscL [Actinomycetota bacterium]